MVSSSVTAPGIVAVADEPAASSRRPNPTGRSAIAIPVAVARREPTGLLVERPQPVHAGQQPPLAVVEPCLDVLREDVAPAGGPDPERDRDRVVRRVGDGDRDPDHPELARTSLGAAVKADGRLPRRQPFDLDFAPADA